MNNLNTCKTYAALLVIACMVLSVTTTRKALAGEDLPRLSSTVAAPPDVLAPLQDYIKVSRAQLAKLDKIIASERGDPGAWTAACKVARRELSNAWGEATRVWKDKYSEDRDRLSDLYQEWYDNERKTWGRLATEGRQLAELHNAIVGGLKKIDQDTSVALSTQIRLERWRKQIEPVVQKTSSALDKVAATLKVLGSSSGVPELEAAGEVAEQAKPALAVVKQATKELDGLSPVSRAYVQYRLQHTEEIEKIRQQYQGNRFGSKRNTVVALHLARSSGEFRDHENRWDDRISKLSSRWENALDEYIEATSGIVQPQLTIQSIGRIKVDELKQTLQKLSDQLRKQQQRLEDYIKS